MGPQQWDNCCSLDYYLWRAKPFSAPVESLVSNKYIWLRFVPTKNVVGVSLSQQHAQASEPHWKRWISAQELIFVILAVLSCDTERSWSCMSGLNAKSRIGSLWSDTYFSVNKKKLICYIYKLSSIWGLGFAKNTRSIIRFFLTYSQFQHIDSSYTIAWSKRGKARLSDSQHSMRIIVYHHSAISLSVFMIWPWNQFQALKPYQVVLF